MAWLRRRPRSRFPHDMLHWLEQLGRYELDRNDSGVDPVEVSRHCIEPLLLDAQNDRKGFEVDLRAIVADDQGGFATYGASRLVWELLGNYETDDAEALLDAGVEVKRTFGFSWLHLNSFEMQRWTAVHGPNSW